MTTGKLNFIIYYRIKFSDDILFRLRFKKRCIYILSLNYLYDPTLYLD